MVMKGHRAETPTDNNNLQNMRAAYDRLLIVDDEPEISRIVELAASQLGLETFAINRSSEFESALATVSPTIIFLDIAMPGRDGVELIGVLAALNFRGGLVLMSGWDLLFIQMSTTIAESRGLTVAGALPKPFRKQTVVDLLTKLAAQSRPEHAIACDDSGSPLNQVRNQTGDSSRRGHVRRTVIKSAQLVFNQRRSTLDCRIRDLSLSGARLVFASQQLLPHTFELHTTDSPTRSCALRWAKDRMAGVQFLSDGD
jgi:DNA-binding response OmpR family regulator